MYSHDDLTHALQEIVEHAEHVAIQWDRVPLFAEHLRTRAAHRKIVIPPWADPSQYGDEFPPENNRDTIQLFFVMIAQGYQHYLLDAHGESDMWEVQIDGKSHKGVHAQYACAARALREGLDILNPHYLVSMQIEDVRRFYADERSGEPTLPDMPGRLDRFHEVGRVLLENYDGHYANLLAAADGYLFHQTGTGIVQRLVSEFPISYGDWPFCKLSVTPARMLLDRHQDDIPSSAEYLHLTKIQDLDHFEAGADVARPFVLMRLGILEVSPTLREILVKNQPVGKTAQLYAEARAAAMLVCRELVNLSGIPSPEIGGELWATGFYLCPRCRPRISDAELACGHKSVCQAYQSDARLFELKPMAGTGD